MPSFICGQQFGIFTYEGDQVHLTRRQLGQRGQFRCKCGALSTLSFTSVMYGASAHCSKCAHTHLLPGSRFGRLTYDGASKSVAPGSTAKVEFVCDCGRRKSIVLRSVLSGASKSCGDCSAIALTNGAAYGKLTYVGPELRVKPSSRQRVQWSCSCGRSVRRTVKSVLSSAGSAGLRGCGKCSEVHLEPGDKYKWFEYAGPSADVLPSSTQCCRFKCRCGAVKDYQIQHITRGQKTCGECFNSALDWYSRNRDLLRSAQSFLRQDFPGGGLIPLANIVNASQPFDAKCPLCGSTYRPRLRDIKRGVSLSCGCTNFAVSSLNLQLLDWLKSIGVDAVPEHSVGGKRFDVAVPASNLLIEINGLRWHSMPGAKTRDLSKHRHAASFGFETLMLFEDEWVNKRQIMCGIIANRLRINEARCARASKCVVERVPVAAADLFYDSHHYIGKAKAGLNYAAFLGGVQVACMSFKRPTRQTSRHEWELVRMASSREVRVHGVWSKLMHAFVLDKAPASVVSFSDNRLFTGGVYSRIGFTLDGDVPQDYYWTKQRSRWHKSGLRKTDSEKATGSTETALRTAQGYRKIWDLGKKRWVWRDSCQKSDF